MGFQLHASARVFRDGVMDGWGAAPRDARHAASRLRTPTYEDEGHRYL